VAAKTRKSKADGTKPSFESLMEELEKIVGQLEGGELSLEKSIELFEKGMGLAKKGMKTLDNAEKRVEMLVREDGKVKTVPFDSGEE
jgi:exodeoxyribonuclease VII small subunit